MAVQISVPCTKCNKDNKRSVEAIDPNSFTDPTKATMLSSYWCSHCESPQVAVYRFSVTDNQVVVALDHMKEASDIFVQDLDSGTKSLTVRCKPKKGRN